MKEIIQSKKGFMAFTALIVLGLVTCVSMITHAGLIDQAVFAACFSAIMGPYLIAQGIADQGKEAVKIQQPAVNPEVRKIHELAQAIVKLDKGKGE